MNPESTTSALAMISNRFEIEWEGDGGDDPEAQLAAFRELLADRIRWIIDNRFGRLAEMLYRIDVDERGVNAVFERAPINEIPLALADLIIARVQQRMETRRRFRDQLASQDDAP